MEAPESCDTQEDAVATAELVRLIHEEGMTNFSANLLPCRSVVSDPGETFNVRQWKLGEHEYSDWFDRLRFLMWVCGTNQRNDTSWLKEL